MGCCNQPVSSLGGLPLDPTQYVNYTRGMVLGVDDFQQEHAWLAGRDQWLARDAVGYGTVSGLQVYAQADGSVGMRLHVSPGAALLPSGKLVCVGADQCAVINQWLAKAAHAALVNALLTGGSPPVSPPTSPPSSSPPTVTSGSITLHLTLCYADCTTRPVPIPGAPCRSEDELMQPSRVADDFRLDLLGAPPAQVEEDALRDFVLWLRSNVTFATTSPPVAPDEVGWLAALRVAVQPWLQAAAASPPVSPPPTVSTLGDYLFDLSPPGVDLAPSHWPDFLRVALRFWVTELRPLWAAMRCQVAQAPDLDCVLLASVTFDVAWIGGSPQGTWQIAGSPVALQIDESRRPVLANVRLLQEWSLYDGAPASAEPYAPGGAVVAVTDGGTGLGSAPGDGQILVGDAGGYAVASLAGTADEVIVTQAAGSIVLSGPQPLAPASTPQFAGLSTTGAVQVALATTNADLALDTTHHVVLCSGGPTITLPKCDASNRGRVYVVRSVDADCKLAVDAADTLSGPTTTASTVKKATTTTVLSDGGTTWHVLATAP